LIVADEESAKLSPDRWPDLSPEALREREALDHTTLDKLHGPASRDRWMSFSNTLAPGPAFISATAMIC
jgi:hypothetical protein